MNKIKIVKIPGPVTEFDLTYWRDKFENNQATTEEMEKAGLLIEELEMGEDHLTLVKVGDETYSPSPTDLENWQKIFEDASKDPDFKIFTHSAVSVERHKLEDGCIMITGEYCVVKPKLKE